MQNVSISCALVCIIIVVTALLIGLFSIFHHQISAMLITAVMYLLAGNFKYIFMYYNLNTYTLDTETLITFTKDSISKYLCIYIYI